MKSGSGEWPNISEGSKRQYTKELIQFLHIAKGSLGESEYYLRLAKDLAYISDEEFVKLYKNTDEIGKMIAGLIKSLKGEVRNG
ncbi:MAG TPA: four helix bundle protein [Desulfobacteria bacterium]|nr:four helix bundle protein [Desulfobacteria bacterium]